MSSINVTVEFTPRQKLILILLSQGKQAKEIASTIHLGERTTESIITNMLQLVNAHNRVELVAIALRNKIID